MVLTEIRNTELFQKLQQFVLKSEKPVPGLAAPEPHTLDVLFLDFDGVLHPLQGGSGLFCHIPKLLPLFQENGNLRLVVTSDWRFAYEDAELCVELQELGPFFLGSTPKIENRNQTYFPGDPLKAPTREREILWFLHDNPIKKWVALDDIPDLYTKDFCHRYVRITNPFTGLNDSDIQYLCEYFLKT